ncbi:MAG: sugar phosphate isomerase/epimerase [Opitutales bacterium]|nr:sugar phosphate isomerase/epimerase [Opitutales bacterium]
MRTEAEGTLAEVARPGVMISNAWPNSREKEGATLAAIESVFGETDYFEALQVVDVPFASERCSIAALVRDRKLPMTYTLTRVFAENGLNLSDLDPGNRERSWRAVIDRFDEAEEAGAGTVGVVSGARPADEERREEALRALEDSLDNIAGAVAQRPLKVLIEPLDYEAHKRCTLGKTVEAVEICRHIAARDRALGLCLDTAHMILNGEDIIEAVETAREFIQEFHFCNCVTDRGHPLFGDRHLPFGSPGLVNTGLIAQKMASMRRMGFLNPRDRPRVLCEVILNNEMTSMEIVRHCQETLQAAWKIACGLRENPDTAP